MWKGQKKKGYFADRQRKQAAKMFGSSLGFSYLCGQK